MDISERKRLINVLADYVVTLDEREADGALGSAGIGVTPSGWAGLDSAGKRRAIVTLLASAREESYQQLIDWAHTVGDDPLAATQAGSGAVVTHERHPADSDREAVAPPDGPIFVVHGHAATVRHEAVRVLERSTGREVIVLHEQPNQGQTILEKFEHHAVDAAYAVVLLTADDRGGLVAEDVRPRGRQNVVFELGFFFGRLGRQRVAVLVEPEVERPSDIDGLVYIPIDPAGSWKYTLVRELVSSGITADLARVP
jgi:predicted nucleotide-binding protein